MKHGQGAMVKLDKVYVGAWEKNLKQGIGYEINLMGNTRRKGEWKKGTLFRWLGGTETVSGSITTNSKFNKEVDELIKSVQVGIAGK